MGELQPKLVPPQSKTNLSVARVENAWYVACESGALKTRLLKREVLGIPLVLFRTEDGRPTALLDRCPHRNLPLSLGQLRGDRLQCSYHGWEFDSEGICQKIPGLCGEVEGKARRVSAFATEEMDGFVWVYMNCEEKPSSTPYRLPGITEPGYKNIRQSVEVEGTLLWTLENALDVPHTAFLHTGLFRGGGQTNDIDVLVKRWSDRVEAHYFGEPRPSGIVARMLSPKAGEVKHVDRFILPSVVQVEYGLGEDAHFIVTTVCTPVADFRTKLYAVVSFKTPLPSWLITPFIRPLAMRVFKQDAAILRQQTDHVKRFGGEQFTSTEADVLGGDIWRLLKSAERNEDLSAEEPTERRLRLHI
jgi:phenylpropionate dioxygenase-like ring-hydroxylating dioxygenase large terminal subunit